MKSASKVVILPGSGRTVGPAAASRTADGESRCCCSSAAEIVTAIDFG